MKRFTSIAVFLFFVFSVSAFAQVDAEREAIKRTALNYAEGWYEGNADKMESALHPDLAKRIARTNDKGQTRLDQMSAMSLVHAQCLLERLREERRAAREAFVKHRAERPHIARHACPPCPPRLRAADNSACRKGRPSS